ncbi:MAG: hypothetical protein H7A21_01205 [Spirochaetales bacterium]|nr:hypothetical protein [Leptospiraceae bacterium]MCP5480026.1 hypothetical protein [Spirochaetales bacterium]MCP5485633.1 hypothetical protein [Spirochaetales bacterium]
MLVESGRGSLFQINVDSGLSVQDLRSTADRFGIRGIGIYDPELRLVQALQISSHPALYVASPTRGVIVMHREYSLGAHARENARKALEAALNE